MGELAGFLAFMATRVPRSIQAAREVGSALASFMTLKFAKKPDEIRKALSLLQEQGTISKDLSVEQMQAILESTDKDFYISFNEKPAMALSLKMSKAIHYELVRMNWCLCRAPSDTEFISGDAPLVCFVLDKNGRAIFGGGYGTPNAEVTFPLSPEKCLYLDHRHNQRYRAVNHKLVKEINKRTAWAAERFIVSRHKSDYAAELSFWSSKSINMPKMDKRELFRQFELKNLFD